MIRSLVRFLLIGVALLTATATLPVAGFWMCRSSLGGAVFFFVAPWTAAVWCLLIVQLGGSRFWRGAGAVREWRAAHGGLWHTNLRGAAWMFAGLILSYGVELAVVFLTPPSPTLMHMFPVFTYSPVALALWSAARG